MITKISNLSDGKIQRFGNTGSITLASVYHQVREDGGGRAGSQMDR